MKCLRCGYGCYMLEVVIVDDPNLGIVEGNLIIKHSDGTPCKHLRGNKPGEYSCVIHNEEWYWQTPCAAYQSHTFGKKETDCRMGRARLGFDPTISFNNSDWP